jgi:hypothetical protein
VFSLIQIQRLVRHMELMYRASNRLLGTRATHYIVNQTAGRTFIAGETNLSAHQVVSQFNENY